MSSSAPVPGASKSVRGSSNGVDRLSSLCDELLHHVMSFLPMPEVVRTSIPSPRWRNLWASTPFIHIAHQDFMDEQKPSGVDEDKLGKFWDNLLLLRDGAICLDEARIFVFSSVDGRTKSSVWIRHAIKHKVRLLLISGSELIPTLDSAVMFPSQHLKIIRLQCLTLCHGFFKPLNHECHMLEHLELENCILSEVKEISSRSLKVLHMVRCLNTEGLLISARNLTHLSILDPICGDAIVTRDLSSLVTASIILGYEEFHCYSDTIVDGHRMLVGLSHVTTLQLHAPLHELAFERGLQSCPVFRNLTSLVLGDWCMAVDLYPLRRILQHAPKLKELNFKLKMEQCSTCKDSEHALSQGGTSLGAGSYPSLERIKISCRGDDPRVGALVQALPPIFIRYGKINIERY